MKVVKTLLAIIALIVLFVMLWFLINFPKDECSKDEDCIPTNPLMGVQYFCDNGVCNTKPLGDPASQYCIENNGTIEMRTDTDGNQYGVCIFPGGSECEEWEFYNGECQPGSTFPKTNCQSNEDCVPEFCCHSSSCVNKENKPDCAGIFCTQECMPGTMDCGQGHCVCLNQRCKVEWT